MTNALPARKDSRVRETVLSPVAPQGFPGQTNLIDFGFDGFPDPYHATPALELLKSAAFFIDAANAKTGDAYAFNQGTGGFALDARYGSSLAIGAADTNDPLLLPWAGTNYAYLPGVASNWVSSPTSVNLDVTGDIEVEADIAFDTLTPGTNQYIMSREGIDPNRAWSFFGTTDGRLGFRWYSTGLAASQISKTSTVTLGSVGIVAGQRIEVRVTLDVDNGASGNDVKFFYSTNNGLLFTQLGSTVTTAGTTSIAAVTTTLGLNTSLGGTDLAAKVYGAIVRNGIGGTTVFDANFTTGITSGSQATFTESSVNAATVTINRSTSGRKSVAVTRPVWLFGTDDYMEVADNALLNMDATQSFTVVAVVRQWATATSYGRYVDKKNGGGIGVGWSLSNEVTSITSASFMGDGAVQASTNGIVATAGTLVVAAAVSDRSAQTLKTFANASTSSAVSTSTLGALTNALPMRLGCSAVSAGSFQDFELLAVAVFRRALTATEIASINTYYGTA